MDTARTTEPQQTASTAQGHATRLARTAVWFLGAILLILAGWALKGLAVVVVPFVVALFIALAVAPLDHAVRRRMPRGLGWLGHAVAMTLVVALLVAFFAGVTLAALQAVGQLPDTAQELGTALGAGEGEGEGEGEGGIGVLLGQDDAAEAAAGDDEAPEATGWGSILDLEIRPEKLIDQTAAYLAEHGTEYARAILSTAANLVTGLTLVFFLALLMLVEGPVWRDKLTNAWGHGGGTRWKDTFAVMARSFRRYVLVTCLVGVVTASLYVGWLMVFGIELLAVWFVLTFLLAFIPTVGSIIAGALPILYTFVTRDWTTALWVAAGIVVIEQVTGNYASPRILGKNLSVSPIVTFFALVLFAWMWGIVGAVLAVPIAVFVVIAAAHVEPLRPLALLLSDRRDMGGLDEIVTR